MNTFYKTYLKPAAIALLAVFVIAGISAVVFEDKGAAGYVWKAAPGGAAVMTVDGTYVDIVAPKFNGTAMTATAAQMNFLSGVTAGTVTASKAVVVGAARNVDYLRIYGGSLENSTIGGTTPAPAYVTALGCTSFAIGGTTVTATAAELNIMDNVTATYTEINKLAGVTAGTATASKAAVLGASGQLNALTIGNATIQNGTFDGASVGATTAPAVTASALTLPVNAASNKTVIMGSGILSSGQATTTVAIVNCSASSLVFCTLLTDNTTAVLKSAVPGTGSFVVTLSEAANTDTTICWQVWK